MTQTTAEYKRETKNTLEKLDKTWFVDIDGTLFKHRTNVELDRIIPEYGIESHLQEEPLPEAIAFINNLPKKDTCFSRFSALLSSSVPTLTPRAV